MCVLHGEASVPKQYSCRRCRSRPWTCPSVLDHRSTTRMTWPLLVCYVVRLSVTGTGAKLVQPANVGGYTLSGAHLASGSVSVSAMSPLLAFSDGGSTTSS